jgi:hypothetical protein
VRVLSSRPRRVGARLDESCRADADWSNSAGSEQVGRTPRWRPSLARTGRFPVSTSPRPAVRQLEVGWRRQFVGVKTARGRMAASVRRPEDSTNWCLDVGPTCGETIRVRMAASVRRRRHSTNWCLDVGSTCGEAIRVRTTTPVRRRSHHPGWRCRREPHPREPNSLRDPRAFLLGEGETGRSCCTASGIGPTVNTMYRLLPRHILPG